MEEKEECLVAMNFRFVPTEALSHLRQTQRFRVKVREYIVGRQCHSAEWVLFGCMAIDRVRFTLRGS